MFHKIIQLPMVHSTNRSQDNVHILVVTAGLNQEILFHIYILVFYDFRSFLPFDHASRTRPFLSTVGGYQGCVGKQQFVFISKTRPNSSLHQLIFKILIGKHIYDSIIKTLYLTVTSHFHLKGHFLICKVYNFHQNILRSSA